MKTKNERPAGYRELGKVIERRKKAIKFHYYRWEIWIPVSAIVKVRNGPYTAPAWAIDSAKDHASAHYHK